MTEEQLSHEKTPQTSAVSSLQDEVECKVVERQQGDGWTVLYKPDRHWERVTASNGYAAIFPDKQEALDYVRDATPGAIVVEVTANRTQHEGKETKPRVDLIDPTFLLGMGRVLGDGAKKYAPNNWRYGSNYSERYASLVRHLAAWHSGETLDINSKENHLYHVATNAMILAYWQLAGRGKDDRARIGE